jgi:hypothetical protein
MKTQAFSCISGGKVKWYNLCGGDVNLSITYDYTLGSEICLLRIYHKETMQKGKKKNT